MSTLGVAIAAAFAAGLAGSGHCAGMCGGIAAAFGAGAGAAGRQTRALVVFNAARLASYALIGVLLATGSLSLAALAAFPGLALLARLLAGLALLALGLRLAFGLDGLGVERLGAAIWRRLRPAWARAARLPKRLRPAALGLLWGCMPCGLVYSVLLLAAASARPAAAALTMLAFGAGTLPSMLTLSSAATPFGARLGRPGFRRAAGVAALAAAGWTLAAALLHAGAGHSSAAGAAPHPLHALAAPAGLCAARARDCL